MEEALDYEHQEKEINLTDTEVFSKIWLEPRMVFKFINNTGYEKYMPLLLVLAGISRAFDKAVEKNMGDNTSLLSLVLICLLVGGLVGWLSYYVYAGLVSWTGEWLKGEGDTASLVRMMAYASLPSVISLVFLFPQLAIYGIELFKSDGDITSGDLAHKLMFWGTIALELILAVWAIVLIVVGTSEVQKLSIGKAILNLILPVLVIAVPLIIIVVIYRSLY